MPEKRTLERAKEDLREGKSPSTAAGEFVREEIEHVREGKHGARSPQQAIAIGLSKARRAGVPLAPPKSGSKAVRERAEHEYEEGQEHPGRKPSSRRSHSRQTVMKREPKSTTSHAALSRQSKRAASKRTAASRSASARKAAASRSPAERSASAKKAATTRTRH
ncbi:MAG TPA: hypothetical protein VL495_04270 [Edaphobacter sp.]|jgi:hypothetical protein|nr:hypothetical protein [Edaphobacter sp.]